MPDPSPHCKRPRRSPMRRVAPATRAGLSEWLLFGLEPAMARPMRSERTAAHPPRQGADERRSPACSNKTSLPRAAAQTQARAAPFKREAHEQADQARPHRQQPRLISRYAATHEADYAAGGGSDDPVGVIGVTFFRFAGARFAADFLAAPFLPADFFAAVLLAELFFAEAFFTAPLRVAFFATTLRADFFAGFLAADFFAVFLAAAFGMYQVPLNHLFAAQFRAMQMRGRKYIRFDFAQALHTRATSAGRGDYRIIARTRASDLSSARALARALDLMAPRRASPCKASAKLRTQSAHDPRFAHIFTASPRIACVCAHAIDRVGEARLRRAGDARSNSIGLGERIKSKRRAC